MPDLPVIFVFGVDKLDLVSGPKVAQYETNCLDCRCYPTDENLMELAAEVSPSAILSIGKIEDFKRLNAAPFSIRRKWIHQNSVDAHVGSKVFYAFLQNALKERSEPPLVSVFTPTYKTGDKIFKPFFSLLAQQYNNWEWVVVDDSDEDDETIMFLDDFAMHDPRVRVFKNRKHSGVIGDVKRTACDLSRGTILVELDHDDHLTPDALMRVVSAFSRFPDVGFVYTDFAEVFEGGDKVKYVDGWGWGYGSYREEEYNGAQYLVANSPNINPKTIRHIVAAPNHIRAWRKSVYDEIGGHNPELHVADDYELMVRTFLKTRMGHIPHMCYVQYRNMTGNTHRVRNGDIQRLVRYISMGYEADIHERFKALGVDDFVWKDGEPSFFRLGVVPNPDVEPHCTVEIPDE